jgi:hypothetical protein
MRIPKATNTHSQKYTLITVPLKQWLHERASVLLYSAVPVLFINIKNILDSPLGKKEPTLEHGTRTLVLKISETYA